MNDRPLIDWEWIATHPSTAERARIAERQLQGMAPAGADGAARFRANVAR